MLDEYAAIRCLSIRKLLPNRDLIGSLTWNPIFAKPHSSTKMLRFFLTNIKISKMYIYNIIINCWLFINAIKSEVLSLFFVILLIKQPRGGLKKSADLKTPSRFSEVLPSKLYLVETTLQIKTAFKNKHVCWSNKKIE